MLKWLIKRFQVKPYLYMLRQTKKHDESLLPAYMAGIQAKILSMNLDDFPKDTTIFFMGYVTAWPKWYAHAMWAFSKPRHKLYWSDSVDTITYQLDVEDDTDGVIYRDCPDFRVWINGTDMIEALLDTTTSMTQFSFMVRRNELIGDYSVLFMTDSVRKADAMSLKMIVPSS